MTPPARAPSPHRPAPAVIAALALVALSLLLSAHVRITGDTWFDLVFGRAIVQRGLPRFNDATAFGAGAPWVNSQWLAHLAWWGVHRVGGVFALVCVRTALLVAALAIPARLALRAGHTPGRIALSTLVAAALVVPFSSVRAQSFGELFFVALVALVSLDRERARASTWAAVPLVALWSNVHGSALLGVAVLALAAVARGIDAVRARAFGPRVHARDAALVAAGALALFASPYGVHAAQHYRATALNPLAREYISEWQPPALDTAPLVLLLAPAVLAWLGWRARRLDPFLVLLGAATSVLALGAVRNGTFLGLALAFVLPALLETSLPADALRFDAPRAFRVANRVLAVAILALAVLQWRTLAARIDAATPVRAADAVARVAGASGLVLADEGYADRLLWQRDDLRGRVAFDARVEVLSAAQLQWIVAVRAGEPSAVARLARFSTVALASREWRALDDVLAHDARWRAVMRGGDVVVYASAAVR